MGRGPDPEILGFLKMWERVTSSPTVLQTYYVLNQDFNELSHDLTKSNYRNSSNRLDDFGLPSSPAVSGWLLETFQYYYHNNTFRFYISTIAVQYQLQKYKNKSI